MGKTCEREPPQTSEPLDTISMLHGTGPMYGVRLASAQPTNCSFALHFYTTNCHLSLSLICLNAKHTHLAKKNMKQKLYYAGIFVRFASWGWVRAPRPSKHHYFIRGSHFLHDFTDLYIPLPKTSVNILARTPHPKLETKIKVLLLQPPVSCLRPGCCCAYWFKFRTLATKKKQLIHP